MKLIDAAAQLLVILLTCDAAKQRNHLVPPEMQIAQCIVLAAAERRKIVPFSFGFTTGGSG